MARKNNQLQPKDFSAPPDKLWERLKVQIIQRWGWRGGLVGVLIPLTVALWWNWKDIRDKPFVSSLINAVDIAFRSTPVPIPGHFNVAIAQLENDHEDETRTELATELQKFASKFNELGTKETRSVEVIPVPVKVGLDSEADQEGIVEGYRQARDSLKKHGYDVLIWGLVRKKEQSPPQFVLDYVGARGCISQS
jgi:hypothetical protein